MAPSFADYIDDEGMMLVVAGVTLKKLEPRVWDPISPYYLSRLEAVMLSYRDFEQSPLRRRRAMQYGLHQFLGAPPSLKIYLDNGSFARLGKPAPSDPNRYTEFVENAKPDWCPVPEDWIPLPAFSHSEQREAFHKTVAMNEAYAARSLTPVVHVGRLFSQYIDHLALLNESVALKSIAVGGAVPYLLRSERARSLKSVASCIKMLRIRFPATEIHVFGIGGGATACLACLMGVTTADSVGWHQRASRGLVQLAGGAERMVLAKNSHRKRFPNQREWRLLQECQCPACRMFGIEGLIRSDNNGFRNRATHNLWIMLETVRAASESVAAGEFPQWYAATISSRTVNNAVAWALHPALPLK